MTDRRLPDPVRQVLRDDVDDARVERIWNSVAARRRRAPRAYLPWAVAVAASLTCALVLWRSSAPVAPVAPPKMDSAPPGPVATAEGGPLVDMRNPSTALGVLETAFSEGSVLRLSPGTEVVPLTNIDREVRLLLNEGHLGLDIQPHGPRKWIVECGVAQIEVLGARFDIERSSERAQVSVERGTVLVRSDLLEQRVVRLKAPGSIAIPAPERATEPEPATARTSLGQAEGGEPKSEPKPPTASAPVWPDRTPKPDAVEVPKADLPPEADSPDRSASSSRATELLNLADDLRIQGRYENAARALSLIVSEHPDDPNASLAAFTLGRIALDELEDPARAAAAFRSALRLGAPSTIEEDIRARLVEAYARANDTRRAREAADEYLERFPYGRRTKEVEAWSRQR